MNVIRAFVQDAHRWQAEAKRLGWGRTDGTRPDRSRGSEAERCRQAAATARHLGVPVGIVIEERRPASLPAGNPPGAAEAAMATSALNHRLSEASCVQNAIAAHSDQQSRRVPHGPQ